MHFLHVLVPRDLYLIIIFHLQIKFILLRKDMEVAKFITTWEITESSPTITFHY